MMKRRATHLLILISLVLCLAWAGAWALRWGGGSIESGSRRVVGNDVVGGEWGLGWDPRAVTVVRRVYHHRFPQSSDRDRWLGEWLPPRRLGLGPPPPLDRYPTFWDAEGGKSRLGFGRWWAQYGDDASSPGSIENYREWRVYAPAWLPAAIFAAPPAAWCVRRVGRRRRRPGACAGCGYDLTGNVSGVCPECGGELRAIRGT